MTSSVLCIKPVVFDGPIHAEKSSYVAPTDGSASPKPTHEQYREILRKGIPLVSDLIGLRELLPKCVIFALQGMG